MSKSKKTKASSLKGSSSISKTQASSLALLISQMQSNSDQVEKDILKSEEMLAVDAENEKKDLPFKHQNEISAKLSEAENLLKDLFLDVDKAKKLKHPQATEIENDISHLHERWLKDCSFYRDIYDQIDDVSLMPRINWGPILIQKQEELNREEYGPNMADLEKQIAAHSILHKEIKAYSSQLCVSSAGSEEKYAVFKKQYNNLLDDSKWRRHYLTSLYEYMQGCCRLLNFLREEQEKIKKQDWSDQMLHPPDIRRHYENFKNNGLLFHESEVNRLQDEGERLIELNHPASETIQAQIETVRNEWQKFLNLCICQETHLENVDEFKKFQMDTEQLSETLTELSTTVAPKSVRQKSNSKTLLQMEGEEKTVQNCEQLLTALRRRSSTISPLKLRRVSSNTPITVKSLCDWETDQASLSRGETFTLKSLSDNENWDVISADGETVTFPGVCFLISPPDPDAIDKVDSLESELAEIKKKRASLAASLKNPRSDVSTTQPSAPVSSAPPDPKLAAVAQQLDQLDSDLANTEQGMLSRLRTPVSRTDPTGDLAKKLSEQERAAEALKALEQQIQTAEADLQPFLSAESGSFLPGLQLRLSAARSKLDSLAALADLYSKKANASLSLESQIQKVDDLVYGLERNLSEDSQIPDIPNAIQTHTEDIQRQQQSVAGIQDDMIKLNQDLEATEELCSSLQKDHQEYCPDIQHQRNEVKQLQSRYTNVANQLKERENLLQEASSAYREFQNLCKYLNSFLDSLPTNQININDGLSQRVMKDLKQKEDDMDVVVDLSQDLQCILSDYETNANKYNGALEDVGMTLPKTTQSLTFSDAIQREEKKLINRYAEATAENAQRQKQIDLARNFIIQNEEKVQMVAQQQTELENQQKSSSELDGLLWELADESEFTAQAETKLNTFQNRIKNHRGVEQVENDALRFHQDPTLVGDLSDRRSKLKTEVLNRSSTHSEFETVNERIGDLKDTIKCTCPRTVTREVIEFKEDLQLEEEAANMQNEIARTKHEIQMKEREQPLMKKEIAILQHIQPHLKEREDKKEAGKLEQDLEILKAFKTFETEISDEKNKCRILNDEIFQTRNQINTLEKLIPNIQSKDITRKVEKIEQNPELIAEFNKLQTSMEEERSENSQLSQEVMELQKRYREVQAQRPSFEVKEIVNEIYLIDPNTEMEIELLRKEIQDINMQNTDLEKVITQVTSDMNALRSEKPKVEFKEVLQEVVKEERSPENEREIQRLNDQVNHLDSQCVFLEDQVRQLQKERDEWKAEMSKIETQFVSRDLIKYESDPLLEKEADRLRRSVREEAQLRRNIEEMVFDLQHKYLLLERQKPEQKLILQEVVHLQKDPRQTLEHDRLSRRLDEVATSRRRMDLELQQLRTKLEDKERVIRESDEHQKRIQAESKLREIRLRITQLENAPPPVEESIIVEEVLKLERDPKLERLTNGLRSDMDKETHDILRIQREIRNVKLKLEILQKEKSGEKTVYKEVVHMEKDQAVEAERRRLREQVSQNKFARQDLEDEIRRLYDKISILRSTKSNNSREETSLSFNKDTLVRENDNLIRELRTLEAKKHNIHLSFQQRNRLMTERTQMNRQKSVKMESDVQRLERQILDEKDKIHERDSTICEILMNLQKDEQAEIRTKETNVSTKITILDPETGKDMSPYDAYLGGLIDRQQYIHLQELECAWEEITSMGPDGETSVLLDRKSGKQYSIKDAIKEGRLTKDDLQQYKQGKLPISEFALLVAGDKTKQPKFTSVTQTPNSSAKSPSLGLTTATETQPIAGIMDTYTNTCFTIRNATLCKLIDPTTAQRLLEAQAATGGITDISNKERYKVHKAAQRGLIEDSQVQRLLNAEKAFTGVEDPMTKECLSVGEAVQKGWMPKDSAIRYMEAQHLTGGLVDPATGRRVTLIDAFGSKMIDSTTKKDLQTSEHYVRDITDPITKEKINYKQALDRCRKDTASGLPMLPASSKEPSYSPAYCSSRYCNV
ncbi:envoplakin-like isoform X2 [Gambusia affinis]|uniref:envoplakin-like isoform X2 n=1 Tax=Gambusia affinis TaxID=33528 RepID=UPI001CDD4C04|nr:envoplakin-like isoform X2 [Gambusia affinis]